MQTKNHKKKGFTLVELIVVIVVIAILTAILIPTIGYVIEHSKETADITTVKLLNLALVEDNAKNDPPETMTDVIKIMKSKGYLIDKITPRSSGDILWDSANNRFMLKKDDKILYQDKSTVKAEPYELWKVVETEKDGEVIENLQSVLKCDSYSHYLKGENLAQSLTLSTGLDVGENANIPSVSYNGNTKAQKVTIRTQGGSLSIDAGTDTVNHYGWVKELAVTAVATSDCYHEHGFVGKLVAFSSGRFIAAKGTIFHETKNEIETIIGSNEKELTKAKFGGHYFKNGKCVVDSCTVLDHEHVYVEISRTDATCEDNGNIEKKCTICDEIINEIINKKGHSWNDGVITKTATCNEVGSKTYTCTICSKTKTEDIPATGEHTYDYTDNGDGTHSAECSVCKDKINEESHLFKDGICIKCNAVENQVDLNADIFIYKSGSYDSTSGTISESSSPYKSENNLQTALDNAKENDLIIIRKDFVINTCLQVSSKTIYINLNGYKIKSEYNPTSYPQTACCVIYINSSNVTIFDTSTGKSGALVRMAGAKINPVVRINNCTLNIYGGTICGETPKNGWTQTGEANGIYAYNSSIKMYGGIIENNAVSGYGGGVSLNFGSSLEMNGGIIRNNVAAVYYTSNRGGGGVYVGYNSSIVMNGGEISGNYVAKKLQNASEVASNSGFKNQGYNGGGIYIDNGGTATLNNGTISGNFSDLGSAIYVANGGTYTINNNFIHSNNFSWSSSDDIYSVS